MPKKPKARATPTGRTKTSPESDGEGADREGAVDRFLPLSEAAFHLLVSLAAGPRHGWAIKREIAELTEGRIELGTGTLYGLIKRQLEQELIAESHERPPSHWDDERRRYYRLTDLGRRVAEAEAVRMERALSVLARVTDRSREEPDLA